ncbi:MAG: TonB-dependent receptor [Prevotella sp.]|nr:TonB-dependent receptor [Prevotella sp.]
MKKARFLFAVMMLMISAVVMAQKTTVKGVLVDEATGESEPFATIRVFKSGKTEKPSAMFLTDVDGKFSHEVSGKGLFDIVFSSVGKEDLKKSVRLGETEVLNLDTVYIKENATVLKGVEVVAQKPLVKMEVDKMTYNVADDADSKSSTVLDMLRKVPMVTVDGQDNISVNGSSSFKVYVDGKPSVMFSNNPSMVFKSMPASAVKNIEVVTNPGARYDAEGAGGVLNIVMNRQDPMAMQSLNGVNGTVRASAGNRSLGGGVFVSGQQGKLSYSANAMVNYSKPGTTDVVMEQQNGDGSILSTVGTTVKLPFTMGNFSLGYELDDMSSLNATFSLTGFNMKNNGTTSTRQTGGAYGQGFGYDTNMKMRNGRTSFSGNVDYQRFFNKERTQSIVLTYQLAYSPSKTEQDNNFLTDGIAAIDLTDRNSINKEHTTDHTFQADFTTPIGAGQTLSLGSKLMMRRATSDAKYYLADVYDERSSMDYLFKNTILAGYAEYAGQFGKVGTKAGLRYEQTWQNVEYRLGQGQDFSTNYGSLVPSASLSYTLSQGSNIGLTYNMRISRPGISYLNPYVNRADPNSLSYGNTDLDVEKSHNIALVYNMFTPKLMMNVNLHHNFTDNAIEQYSFFDGTLLNTTYGNIVKRHQTGANVYANWLAAPKTRIMLNGGLNYTDMRSSALDLKNSGWTANAMFGLQQTLPWDLKLGAFLITSTKSYTLQGWSSGFNLLTANISKSFFNDKLNLSLQGMMGLSDGGNLKMESYSQGKNFLSHQDIKVPMSGVTFSVSYTFGNLKKQPRQHVSRVQNDYIEQQSQGEMLNTVGSGTGNGGGTGTVMP